MMQIVNSVPPEGSVGVRENFKIVTIIYSLIVDDGKARGDIRS
jgi:hypothetical protein